jgi:hypothetical protein
MDPKKWVSALPRVELAMNRQPHTSLGMRSSYEIFFNRKPRWEEDLPPHEYLDATIDDIPEEDADGNDTMVEDEDTAGRMFDIDGDLIDFPEVSTSEWKSANPEAIPPPIPPRPPLVPNIPLAQLVPPPIPPRPFFSRPVTPQLHPPVPSATREEEKTVFPTGVVLPPLPTPSPRDTQHGTPEPATQLSDESTLGRTDISEANGITPAEVNKLTPVSSEAPNSSKEAPLRLGGSPSELTLLERLMLPEAAKARERASTSYNKRHTIESFGPGDSVSLMVPRADRTTTDPHRFSVEFCLYRITIATSCKPLLVC